MTYQVWLDAVRIYWPEAKIFGYGQEGEASICCGAIKVGTYNKEVQWVLDPNEKVADQLSKQ